MKSEFFRRKERIRTSKKENPEEPNKEKLLKISVGIEMTSDTQVTKLIGIGWGTRRTLGSERFLFHRTVC